MRMRMIEKTASPTAGCNRARSRTRSARTQTESPEREAPQRVTSSVLPAHASEDRRTAKCKHA
eukprot:5733377-Prymnesium_polylepis.1